MKKKLERIVPPGYGMENIFTFMCLGLLLCWMIASGFLLELERNHKYLHRIPNFVEYFGEDRITYFVSGWIRERCFTVLAVLVLAFVPMHYAYYYRESKSIYTMRRMGRPLELHIRVWSLPLILSSVTLILRAITIALLFCYYLSRTADTNAAPDQWEEVWRLIIYDRNY